MEEHKLYGSEGQWAKFIVLPDSDLVGYYRFDGSRCVTEMNITKEAARDKYRELMNQGFSAIR